MRRKYIVSYIICILLLIFTFAPLLFMFIGSIMPETELRSQPGKGMWFVRGPVFDYYKYIFLLPLGIRSFSSDPYIAPSLQGASASSRAVHVLNVEYYLPTLVNSTIVAGFVALINLSLASIAAFAFARMNFKGRTGLYTFVLMSRLLPPAILVIPYYMVMQLLNLTNELPSVIIIHSVLTLPFSIWYMVLYYRTIPIEMDEAALVDGASLWQTIRRISLPMATSGLVAIALFSFLLSYNELMFAHFLLGRIQIYTVPVYMAYLSTSLDIYWGLIYTMLVLTILPMIALILVFSKLINFSQLAGAVKM